MRCSWPLLGCVLVGLFGCSALINPDDGLLGGGPADTGITLRDGTFPDGGGPRDGGPGRDAGPRPDAGDRVDAGGVDAGDCVARCEGGQVTTCDSIEVCELGCSPSGEPRCAEFVPSNVSSSYWESGATDITVLEAPGGGVTIFDTDSCTAMTAATDTTSQLAGGPEVCVLSVRNLTVDPFGHLRIIGSRPAVIMATGDVLIEGVIDVSAFGTEIAGGAAAGGVPGIDGGRGQGDDGGREGRHVDTFEDGGGGGGAFCGDGGDGGLGGAAEGGEGGGGGDPNFLMPLRGGSGGGIGRGGDGTDGFPFTVGLGGGSGGALQISAEGSIQIDGFILASGGGGRGGIRTGGSNWGAGGGGGSGGGVLLESPTIAVDSAGGVTTSGGGGGGGAGGSSGSPGEDGRRLGQAPGGATGGGAFGSSGGASGGGLTPDGVNGGNNGSSNANGAGGGGGVGCVVVRSLSGVLAAGEVGRFSGAAEPSLFVTTIVLN